MTRVLYNGTARHERRRVLLYLPLVFSLVILVLSGCAGRNTTTAVGATISSSYAPASDASDYGYYDTRIADDAFEVTFRGDQTTNIEQVADFALLRSASVALANQCAYFAIVDRDTVVTEDDATSRSVTISYVTISCLDDAADDDFPYDAEFLSRSVSRKHGLTLP